MALAIVVAACDPGAAARKEGSAEDEPTGPGGELGKEDEMSGGGRGGNCGSAVQENAAEDRCEEMAKGETAEERTAVVELPRRRAERKLRQKERAKRKAAGGADCGARGDRGCGEKGRCGAARAHVR